MTLLMCFITQVEKKAGEMVTYLVAHYSSTVDWASKGSEIPKLTGLFALDPEAF